VQDISIVARSAPNVYWPSDSTSVFLVFEGLRESRTAADRLTRIRVTLPPAQARQLWETLGQHVPTLGAEG
jgi:hypothetical protein